MDRNVLAIEKARDAYRQQFDIGQRSLLDLLNAENELYTAKRAYANAEFDLMLAYARTQAARHNLTTALGLSPSKGDVPEGAQDWQSASEASQRCPVVAIDVASTSRADLDARARKLAGPAISAPAEAPAIQPVTSTQTQAADTVGQRLRTWAEAWMSKDPARYFSFYAEGFTPSRSTPEKWRGERTRALSKPGAIDVKLDNIKVTPTGDEVTTSFTQTYTSSNFQDKTTKTLTWKELGGNWVIVKESNR